MPKSRDRNLSMTEEFLKWVGSTRKKIKQEWRETDFDEFMKAMERQNRKR